MNKRQGIKRDNIRFSRRYKTRVRRIDIVRELKMMRARNTCHMLNLLQILCRRVLDRHKTMSVQEIKAELDRYYIEYSSTAWTCRVDERYPVSDYGFRIIITYRPFV